MKNRSKLLMIFGILLLVLLFLIPVKGNIKDGGSEYYHPLIPIYEVVNWNGLVDGESRTTGTTVKLFGIEIFDNYRIVE